jgi:hypothetical protein
VVEYLPSKYKVLSSTPSTVRIKTRQNTKRKTHRHTTNTTTTIQVYMFYMYIKYIQNITNCTLRFATCSNEIPHCIYATIPKSAKTLNVKHFWSQAFLDIQPAHETSRKGKNVKRQTVDGWLLRAEVKGLAVNASFRGDKNALN